MLMLEQLAVATAEVKSLLGNRKIADQEIHDSLWHYDLDSSKAAKYLSDKYDKAQKKAAAAAKPSPAQQQKSKGMSSLLEARSQQSQSQSQSTGPDQRVSKLAALAKARSNQTNVSPLSSSSPATESPRISKLDALAKSRAQKGPDNALPTRTQSSNGSSSLEKLSRLSSGAGSSGANLAKLSKSSSPAPNSALSKLAQFRKQRQEQQATQQVAATPDDSSTDEPQTPPPPETAIDFDIPVHYPPIYTSASSDFGSLLWSGSKNLNLGSKVTNTVFLPTDSSQIRNAFKKPSPDDVVLNAQSQGGFAATASSKKQDPVSKVEKGVESLKIGSSNKPVAQNNLKINVDQEIKKADLKPSINFVVIGHVDAGKSTLMGRLLYDTGAVDPKTMQKYEKESKLTGKGSFALAWVLDQTEEERRRGVTMDICISQFETTEAKFTIVDAPGHKDFVPNMIAGSSQADFAVLVVDAATGAFESGFSLDGQTKEHAVLVRSLGVDAIIVAVNKLDTVDWAEARFQEIEVQLTEFLKKVGFKTEQISFVPTSGLLGTNVVKDSAEKGLGWYKGPTLLRQLELSHQLFKPKDHNLKLRLIIADVFKAENSSDLTISGRIDTGNVQVGEKVYLAPSGKVATVKRITRNAQADNWAIAGDNVSLQMSDIDKDDVIVGDVVCSLDAPVKSAQKFSCRLVVFDVSRPITIGARFIAHRGRTNAPCKVSKLVSTLDKATGQVVKSRPRHLTSGQTAVVEITLESRAIPMELFKNSKELGRIVLRKEGTTIAAGVVDDISS
uniref:Elongation factor 1 alpha-like protein n=1 Tax=Blastobotrys adeninivorans TaxID=409370 RepID=A0A060T253_BLAAD